MIFILLEFFGRKRTSYLAYEWQPRARSAVSWVQGGRGRGVIEEMWCYYPSRLSTLVRPRLDEMNKDEIVISRVRVRRSKDFSSFLFSFTPSAVWTLQMEVSTEVEHLTSGYRRRNCSGSVYWYTNHLSFVRAHHSLRSSITTKPTRQELWTAGVKTKLLRCT